MKKNSSLMLMVAAMAGVAAPYMQGVDLVRLPSKEKTGSKPIISKAQARALKQRECLSPKIAKSMGWE
jgi:hypothetical protein